MRKVCKDEMQTNMSILSSLWKTLAWAFDPVQRLFNGNYWEVFVQTFGDLRNDTVLDLGCGTGEVLQYIHPRLYTGVDSNSSYVEFANRNFSDETRTFVLADVLQYHPSRRYSTVLLSNIAHHLSDSDMRTILDTMRASKCRTIIVVDGYPKKPFTSVLWWLDDVLAGGKYFRARKELIRVLSHRDTIIHQGEFQTRRSLYTYPYVVLKLR